MAAFGVYVHFPYCRKRCPYCDFAVHARKSIPHERYAEAVRAELDLRAPRFAGRRAISLYFGGGTPGLWRPDCLESVVTKVRERFQLDGEVTVEANPDDLPPEQVAGLYAAGVNRISLGVQSLQPKHLTTLGRLHGPDQTRATVREARRAGFRNISIDLMFALPAQTMAELDADLEGVLAMEPEHVSVYNLTVEERTAFHALARRGELRLPDEGLAADMFARIDERLAQGGFAHYEISSWARPGHRAVHNTLYWTGGEYLGLGCSAHSFRRLPSGGGERTANVRNVDGWLRALGQGEVTAETTELDASALDREAMWLGLRFLDGIARAPPTNDPVLRHRDELERLRAEGLVDISPERVKLTPRGVLFADEVGARFL
jgi:oxygen-independent coproporphyrinogen-3 oxidase